jgi:hypothetical protein
MSPRLEVTHMNYPNLVFSRNGKGKVCLVIVNEADGKSVIYRRINHVLFQIETKDGTDVTFSHDAIVHLPDAVKLAFQDTAWA